MRSPFHVAKELERCRKRLGSLASVRPAFMDEPGGRKQREAEDIKHHEMYHESPELVLHASAA